MGRLIDVDALFPNGVFLVDEKNPMKSITELINRIANAPTAYDVEKVVAELEGRKELLNMAKISTTQKNVGQNAYNIAIDIVKAGGVE